MQNCSFFMLKLLFFIIIINNICGEKTGKNELGVYYAPFKIFYPEVNNSNPTLSFISSFLYSKLYLDLPSKAFLFLDERFSQVKDSLNLHKAIPFESERIYTEHRNNPCSYYDRSCFKQDSICRNFFNFNPNTCFANTTLHLFKNATVKWSQITSA